MTTENTAPAPFVGDSMDFERTSFLYGANAGALGEMYERFSRDPGSVDEQWRAFFASLGDLPERVRQEHAAPSWGRPIPAPQDGKPDAAPVKREAPPDAQPGSVTHQALLDSIRAIMMIRAYRIRGHLIANLDPLHLLEEEPHPELEPANYGFQEADYDRPIFINHVLGLEYATVREILDILRRTYCGNLAVEFMHISSPEQKSWIQERIEGKNKEISFTDKGKRAILSKLIHAEGFEKFLHLKYTGTKRFGLDGGESAIPALEQIIKCGGNLGVREIVLGMPHRGRLSVLAIVMGKPYQAIFKEFHGGTSNPEDVEGSGDVKYHLGSSSDRDFDGHRVHLSLTANPSHLEIVDPVVLGKARAKQDQWRDKLNGGGANGAAHHQDTGPEEDAGPGDRDSVIPLLLHGDAAFAGQGVVAECFGLSGLRGHKSGGSIHFIVNNQIGFTTVPHFSRSSPYPSDVAKMVQAPIFHVNGDDPEAVVFAARLATEFRQKFGKPVVVDMFCYRRFGHNESDEPMFTQPLMYKEIKRHPTTLEIYAKKLVGEGLVSQAEVDAEKETFRQQLEAAFETAEHYQPNKADWLDGKWHGLERASGDIRRGDTQVETERLRAVGMRITDIPDAFHAHRKVRRIMEQRRQSIESGEGVDWATAESLAFATLLQDGYGVRLSGQDVERGTFSQRHCVLIGQEREDNYTPLAHADSQQARFEVVNSMLSESAVLGFEYGYSLAEPNCLVLWEAQFGDFANNAQVVIDQFIAAGEHKWLRMSGLVMLLPHGYEGQGPEHSSARLERYLQLCAEDNLQVANCTTPMNYFHILRRQMHRAFRKPLILMTPKSLLRHKRCISRLDEMGDGSSFHRLLWDDAQFLPEQKIRLVEDGRIRRVVLCSGKIYYDLYEEREKRGIDDIYLLRIEQLYPFPAGAFRKETSRFANAEFVWCQEEPRNMGAWSFVEPHIEEHLKAAGARAARPRYAGRAASASTAAGLASEHNAQLRLLLSEALGE